MIPIRIPQESVSDDSVRLVQILVYSGQTVAQGEVLFEFESSKSVFEIVSPEPGTVAWNNLTVGEFYKVGATIAQLGESAVSKSADGRLDDSPSDRETDVVWSNAGRRRFESCSDGTLPQGRMFIRAVDLEDDRIPSASVPAPAEALVEQSADGENGQDLLILLQTRRDKMQADFDRHVPIGTLLNDRWSLAESLGFGAGSSSYDESLILGDVLVGKDCWIGPFTVLDGAHARLTIGDSSSIGAGAQLYTHDASGRFLTGREDLVRVAETRVGAHCFIGPGAIIGPGSTLGDRCFVAAGAYVSGRFPDNSFIQGNPARKVGIIQVREEGVVITRPDGEPD